MTVRYGSRLALAAASFDLFPGEVVALVGPNGAGKSSLLKAIVGLVPHEGEVHLRGRTCHHRHHRLAAAIIPQGSVIDLDFPISVAEVVRSGRRPFTSWGGRSGRPDRQAADLALQRVGLEGFGNRPLRALSGGELQRVLLARSLAQEADVLLLDEALSGVDRPATLELLGLLGQLADAGAAVILSTHDLALARHRFERCVALNGRIVADGHPTQVLDPAGLDATFGSGDVLADLEPVGPSSQ
ncbi:MAG: metal ABC transporter ATP-binding protein [Acidimicrobiales bacterium]